MVAKREWKNQFEVDSGRGLTRASLVLAPYRVSFFFPKRISKTHILLVDLFFKESATSVSDPQLCTMTPTNKQPKRELYSSCDVCRLHKVSNNNYFINGHSVQLSFSSLNLLPVTRRNEFNFALCGFTFLSFPSRTDSEWWIFDWLHCLSILPSSNFCS